MITRSKFLVLKWTIVFLFSCSDWLINVCRRKKELKARTVWLGCPEKCEEKYPKNAIKNQKYNVFTFIPGVRLLTIFWCWADCMFGSDFWYLCKKIILFAQILLFLFTFISMSSIKIDSWEQGCLFLNYFLFKGTFTKELPCVWLSDWNSVKL